MFLCLLVSYESAFCSRKRNLTADPAEHIKRAKKMLNKNNNSNILYVAIELRFALERMAHNQILFANEASNRMIDEIDPLKKLKNISRIDNNADYPHEIYFENQNTKEKIKWAEYTPIDLKKAEVIKGKLGNILHAKEGLSLGLEDDPYYTNTKLFLKESLDYLQSLLKGYNNYFTLKGIKEMTFIKK